MIKRHIFKITTDGGGDYTDSGASFAGIVTQMRYIPGTIVTGADLTVTLESSRSVSPGQPVINEDNMGTANVSRSPRQAYHDTGGSHVAYNEYIYSAGEHLKVVIANGGATKSGTLFVWSIE